MQDLFAGLAAQIDFDPGAREKYEALVASSNRVLDVGGRNSASASRKRLTRSYNTRTRSELLNKRHCFSEALMRSATFS